MNSLSRNVINMECIIENLFIVTNRNYKHKTYSQN